MTNAATACAPSLPRTSIARLRLVVRRVPALGLSFAAHGLALAALLYAGAESKPPQQAIARLVFVDAPPAPSAPIAEASPPAAVTDLPAAAPKPAARRRAHHVRREPIATEPATVAPAPPAVLSSASEEPSQSAPSPPAAGGDAGPIPAASAAKLPVLVDRVVPVYPSAARRRGIAGLVRLEAVLDVHGRIEEPIRVLQSIAELDPAAIEALRRWRFAPARNQQGEPVAVILEVPILFVLR